MNQTIAMMDAILVIMVILLVIALHRSWNTGVLGGIRRTTSLAYAWPWGKKAYLSHLLSESLLIGVIGSAVGTAAELPLAYCRSMASTTAR